MPAFQHPIVGIPMIYSNLVPSDSDWRIEKALCESNDIVTQLAACGASNAISM